MKVLLNTLVAAAVLAALLVPAAGAGPRPDDRSEARGPGALPALDPAIAAVVAKASREQRLDTALANAIRDARPHAAATAASAGRPLDERLDTGLANAIRDAAATSSEAAPVAGVAGAISWGDVGAGAGAVGFALLALAGVVLARRRRGQLTGA